MNAFDVIIIGFGKGGKTLAAEFAKRGRKVAIVERSDKMYGGTCINIGCIPTKTLVHQAKIASGMKNSTFEERREFYRNAIAVKESVTSALRDKNYHNLADHPNVTVYTGVGSFVSADVVSVRTSTEEIWLTSKQIIINTGAETIIPPIEGIADNSLVYTSTSIMELTDLPRRLVIVGGGYIGLEFASMYASVRNKGRTIGYVIEEYIGKTGKKLFLLFCWLFCILVVAAFADVVAGTFNGFSTASDGTVSTITANGSVAMTSMLFIIEAVALGFILRYAKLNKWINTAIAVVLLAAAIVIGLACPIYVSQDWWHIIVFIYILIASVVPVWALLQPRDYLNSYLLIFMIVGAVIGVFVANPSCNLKAFTSFNVDGQYMFPILFVTIACGAVSGFHSLVSSGTASKQIKNEKNMLPVSFGAMLMESMLAILALIAVASFGKGEAAAQGLTTQPQIFAGAIANFLSVLGLPHSLVFTLINLAVSAFALTSLDSVARVGRLSFQEFWLDSDTDDDNMSPFVKLMTNKYFATIITLVLAFLLTKVGYAEIWPLFGSANQLLSVLALVACAVFLKKTKRQGCMLWIPMVFMMAVTFTALGMTIYKLTKALFSVGLDLGNSLQLIFAVLLLILGVLVAIQGVKKLCEKSESKKAAA